MPSTDTSKVALIGHSGGAQCSIVYASEPGSIVDAVVSLDTTQDYYFNDKNIFLSYLQRVSTRNLKVPLLVAANRPAVFELMDMADQSRRLYLKVDQLGHEEFTSEGLAADYVLHKEKVIGVKQRYTALCETVGSFLDSTLKHKPIAFKPPTAAPEHFEWELVPRGVSSPPAYSSSTAPPSPRQLRVLLESDPNRAISAIESFAKSHASAPIYDEQLAFAVVDHLLETKNVEGAKRIIQAYKNAKGAEVVGVNIFLTWGRIYSSVFKDEAIRSYEKALMLDPKNEEAKKQLAGLKQRPKPSTGTGPD